MSKSVDQTVLDYFSLLLNEQTDSHEQEEHVSPVKQDGEVQPSLQPQRAPLAKKVDVLPQEYVEEPQLNKQALEELLAPVFSPEIVEPKLDVQVEIDAKVNTEQQDEQLGTPDLAVKVSKEVEQEIVKASAAEEVIKTETVDVAETAPETEQSAPPSITKDLQQQLEEEFQLLFFKVAGLILAVPLVNLGGIVRVEKINSIFGRPNWFYGVQTHRDSQLNIVDTCAWVMPEKYDEALAETVDYQYLVVLEDSNWGLACESLVNTVKVDKSQINWRSKPGKRPWLAGVVKEQMCGILNVESLIEMLNAGLGCQDPID